MIKIGIDFDNTISNYDNCFNFLANKFKKIKNNENKINKEIIKKKIIKEDNGNKTWMKFQGLAYGKYINKAEIMKGFMNFLLISKSRNLELFVVSHKTEFGHYDKEKTPLRAAAIKWMKDKKIIYKQSGIKEKNIYFANTREDKIRIISELNLDFFIDDLKIVLNNKKFPKVTKKILFGSKVYKNLISFSSWPKITNFFFNPINISDIKLLTYFFHKNNYIKIRNIKNIGNNNNFKITLQNNKNYFVKLYSSFYDDNRDRLGNEFKSLKLLNRYKSINTAKPITFNKDLNIGIYEYIYGKKINVPSNHDIDNFIFFIKNLKKISLNYKFLSNQKLASETSISLKDLIKEISNRKKKLDKNIDIKYLSLSKDLDILWQRMKVKNIKIKNQSYKKYFILSPSDIGLHNVIKKNKDIYFVDFEYFGLDDPLKITIDFILHPANKLNFNQIINWYDQMKKIFSNINNFDERFKLLLPYYLFRWILIISKIFYKNNQKIIFDKNYDKTNNIELVNKMFLVKKYIKILNKINKSNYIDFNEFSYEQ